MEPQNGKVAFPLMGHLISLQIPVFLLSIALWILQAIYIFTIDLDSHLLALTEDTMFSKL